MTMIRLGIILRNQSRQPPSCRIRTSSGTIEGKLRQSSWAAAAATTSHLSASALCVSHVHVMSSDAHRGQIQNGNRETSLRYVVVGASILVASSGYSDDDILVESKREIIASRSPQVFSDTPLAGWNDNRNKMLHTAFCEPHSNSSNNPNSQQTRSYHSFYKSYYNNDDKKNDNHNSKSNLSKEKSMDSESDSFFDMAQQWAAENLPKPSPDSDPKGDDGIKRHQSKDVTTDNEKEESNIFDGPEAFLREFGLLKGVVSPPLPKSSDTQQEQKLQQIEDDDSTKSQDENFAKHLDSAKERMQSFLDKLQDDFQSSLPKPSSSSSDKDTTISKMDSASAIKNEESNKSSVFDDFFSLAKNASSIFSSSTKKDSSPPDIHEIVQQAQSIANQLSSPSSSSNNSSSSSSSYNMSSLDSHSSSGFLSQVLYFQKNAQTIQNAFESSFGPHLSTFAENKSDVFQSLSPTALHYFLEVQDSIKTPSWKRRMHRFQKSVEVERVEELNEALILSELSYADSVEEVREGLKALYSNNQEDDVSTSTTSSSSPSSRSSATNRSNRPHWELLFCDTKSRPNQPSHFLAIQKNASPYDDALHILMVVRGTKSMSDLITDAMMEATEYEICLQEGMVVKGKAHSGMIQSGRYLVQRHEELISTLLKLSNKRKVEITLIGHSLGAGAATIAAMEWNSQVFRPTKPNSEKEDSSGGNIQVSAHVVGFGCPALLSEPLTQITKDYVTTVIADADVIPRMSGATLVNLLLDLRKFDYRKLAERDVEQALKELQTRFTGSSFPYTTKGEKSKTALPFRISDEDIQKVMGYVHSGLQKVVPSSAPKQIEGAKVTDKEDEVAEERMKPVLFPPGTCIHFYRDGSGIDGTYVPCSFFNEIDVARTMVDDHLISSGYRRIFLNLMRDFHRDDHFTFESSNKIGASGSKS